MQETPKKTYLPGTKTLANKLRPLNLLTHEIIRQCVKPGDFVIDATAGRGQDSLFLAKLVGEKGRVLAIDIQEKAINLTRKRLTEAHLPGRVSLVKGNHKDMQNFLAPWLEIYKGISAAMFNLGYLPGSDKDIDKKCVTQKESTLAACDVLLNRMKPDGIISLHIYEGHAGGAEESAAIVSWAKNLNFDKWRVWQISEINKPQNIEHLLFIKKRTLSDKE